MLQSKDYEKLKEAVINSHGESKLDMFIKLMSFSHMTGQPLLYINRLISLASRIGVH